MKPKEIFDVTDCGNNMQLVVYLDGSHIMRYVPNTDIIVDNIKVSANKNAPNRLGDKAPNSINGYKK